MRLLRLNLPLVCAFLVVAACNKLVPGSAEAYKPLVVKNEQQLIMSDGAEEELSILYTGCGGLFINKGKNSVLTDPFYSNKNFWAMQVSATASCEENINKVMQVINKDFDSRQIATVLISHSHYDHLMDLPYLVQHNYLSEHCVVMGSTSAKNALNHIIKRGYTFKEAVVQDSASAHWVRAGSNMRVSFIASQHGPHFSLLGKPRRLMDGNIDENGVKGFDTVNYRAKYTRWLIGDPYSMLVEVQGAHSNKTFRIFVQSSSCDPPYGIPLAVSGTDSIDLAFIGVASASLEHDYPLTLLKHLRAKKVVLVHWEDFFRSFNSAPKTVRGTRFPVFFARLDSFYHTDALSLRERIFMPEPMTLFKIKY